MHIPSHLEAQIRDGNVVLVLGAGASMAAQDEHGRQPPSASRLSQMLSERFLGGKYADYPLSQVGEFAVSESSLFAVQDYLRSVFDPFRPSRAHAIMTSFRWWGLATTNYDLVIEQAYDANRHAIQTPVPFIENGDQVDDKMRDRSTVMLLKLHGCITRISNERCPLILTTEQYIQHRQGRSRIFDHLRTMAYEHPIIFIGHSLQDSDLRAILLDLSSNIDTRPRYYAVAPHYEEIETRFWEQRKITAMKGSFEEFMAELDDRIPTHHRMLAATSKPTTDYPIYERCIDKHYLLSNACIQFFENDVEYVKGISTGSTIEPSHYYRGYNPGWEATEQSLDVRRNLADTILVNHLLVDEKGDNRGLEFVLIRASAGAGKSVLLKRIAWDAAHDYDCLTLFMRRQGVINTAALQEIISSCDERVYLFVDDVADSIKEVKSLLRNIGPEGKRLSIIAAERSNEWNVSCEDLSPSVTNEYELRYLASAEIDSLITLLENNHSLGVLEKANSVDRRKAFEERAGRQLLVALHEATLGKPFEDILEDEYANIKPTEAQRMYLSICVLNRLNVPVRAGIIARIHGIQFEEFKRRLFAPLHHVVFAEYDQGVRDNVYRARHPHIAEIVFDRILRNPEERFDIFIRCLQELNIDYAADNTAFRQMTRGRTLADLFPNHEMVTRIFSVARDTSGDDAFLLHQMALYEMHRPNGSMREAGELLAKALHLASHDYHIRHSIAEHRLRCADSARTPLEQDALLTEARNIAVELIQKHTSNVHPYHTLVKVQLRRLDTVLDAPETDGIEIEIENIVKDAEKYLSDALQRFPGEPYLLEAEAQLAHRLSDSERALQSLRRAFDANPRGSYIALRYIQCLQQSGNSAAAIDVAKKALDANRNEKKLHHAYAKLLMETTSGTNEEIMYHLKRAYSPGDSNHEAQLLHGRQLYMIGEIGASKEVFTSLSMARVGLEYRDRASYLINQEFRGVIERIEANYCFISRDGLSDWVFCQRSSFDPPIWARLTRGNRVRFNIGFNFRGPIAVNVRMAVAD